MCFVAKTEFLSYGGYHPAFLLTVGNSERTHQVIDIPELAVQRAGRGSTGMNICGVLLHTLPHPHNDPCQDVL